MLLRTLLLITFACRTASSQNYTVSTVAGGGLPGNTPGAYGSLFQPMAVAVDKAGNVFFADRQNAVMRMDAVTTLVTVVAGNGEAGSTGDNSLATAARINGSTGIALDSAGNLYLTDNETVRRVSNRVITTAAGSNGQLYLPRTEKTPILQVFQDGSSQTDLPEDTNQLILFDL